MKNIILFSDSIPRGLRMREFNRYIRYGKTRLKSFPGATSKELSHYIEPTIKEESFDMATIHVGVNDLLNGQNNLQHESLLSNIMDIVRKCKHNGIREIIISSIVITGKIEARVITEVNESIKNLCRVNGLCFVNNVNISSYHLYKDRLHLLEPGKCILANNLIDGINEYFLLTHIHNDHP